jgi:hypothetical protein
MLKTTPLAVNHRRRGILNSAHLGDCLLCLEDEVEVHPILIKVRQIIDG